MVAFAAVAANANCRHEAEPVCRRFLVACIAQFPRATDMAKNPANKMDASKENAGKAIEELVKLSDSLPEEMRTQRSAHLVFLQEFVQAAQRRLPTQKAIDKDKLRKKKYASRKKQAAAPAPAAEPVGV